MEPPFVIEPCPFLWCLPVIVEEPIALEPIAPFDPDMPSCIAACIPIVVA